MNCKMNKMHIKWIIVFSLQIILVTAQGHDSRCYLEGGGSAENFIVSEDISVGAIIGKLKINGNPGLNGNIKLSLTERDRDAPVQIEPGSKDLILTSLLDKEGERGPSSVYVNVVCDRLHSDPQVPSFVIPVNIRITDVNDNPPLWRGAPYSISLSETTVVGTRILQGARAVDADQPGPFSTVEYSVLPGPFSDYVDFVNPLEGTLQLKKPLDFEQLRNFTVKLRAQDQGNPPKFSDTFLRVFIIDADDQNPRFEFESYTAEFPQDGHTGRLKIYPKAIRAWDQDDGIQADIIYSISASSSPDAKFFSINPKSGEIELITPFDVHKTTLVVRATQIDNKDRYTLTTVNIMRSDNFRHDLMPETSNTNDNRYAAKLQFIQTKHQISVRENSPVGSRILSLPTNRPGDRSNLHYRIMEPDQAEFFEIGQYGDVVLKKQLDFEKMVKHIFHVTVYDEQFNNATCQVIVEVLNVNDWDPRFRQPFYRFKLPTRNDLNETYSIPMAVGKVEAADGDVGDKINFNLRGQHSTLFTIDARGMIWLKEPLQSLKKSEISLIATATDSGQRSTSVPVTFIMDPEMSQAKYPSFVSIIAMLFIIFVFIVILASIYVYKR
jgi:Cadherin domain